MKITPKGQTLGDTLRMLLDEHKARKAAERMAWEARLARARKDPKAVDWAERTADQLVQRLAAR